MNHSSNRPLWILQVSHLPRLSPSPLFWQAAAVCRPPVLPADCCSSPQLCLNRQVRSSLCWQPQCCWIKANKTTTRIHSPTIHLSILPDWFDFKRAAVVTALLSSNTWNNQSRGRDSLNRCTERFQWDFSMRPQLYLSLTLNVKISKGLLF